MLSHFNLILPDSWGNLRTWPLLLCLEAAVRVLADTQAFLCGRKLHRAGMIQQQKRADARPQLRIGKQRAYRKTVADPVMRRVTLDRDEFLSRTPGIRCWHGLFLF